MYVYIYIEDTFVNDRSDKFDIFGLYDIYIYIYPRFLIFSLYIFLMYMIDIFFLNLTYLILMIDMICTYYFFNII